ncbi:MAG UNVERIFIED_CONTAM: RsmD family RNA methyltransferase [Planctomycetaceae bacterium]|jgi:16S rRNA (guanine966-N2)-methyltransferase
MALRIISGKYRRRLLKTPSDDSTRPYTDRVRQMTFDRLAAFVPGARVADIFAGVGTMGMAGAQPRRAASCVFFEGSAEVHQLLAGNVRAIAPDARAICWRTDIRRTSFRPRGGEDCIPYSLLFFDPPYKIADEVRQRGSLAPCLKLLSRSTLSTPEAILVLRTPEHFDAPDVPGWLVHDCWELSSMMVWILVKPDAFVEDREEAAREADRRIGRTSTVEAEVEGEDEGEDEGTGEDEFLMKMPGEEGDAEVEFAEDVSE